MNYLGTCELRCVTSQAKAKTAEAQARGRREVFKVTKRK